MTERKKGLALIAGLVLCQLSACSAVDESSGEPRFGRMKPWGTPTAGFSATAARVPADWNRELRIFEVRGHDCTFLRSAILYRRARGRWQQARGIEGPWRDVATTGLPLDFRWPEAEAACDPAAAETREARSPG